MKNRNYIFRFHNPNEEKETVSVFLHTVIQANTKNIEAFITNHFSANEPQHISDRKQQPLSVSGSRL